MYIHKTGRSFPNYLPLESKEYSEIYFILQARWSPRLCKQVGMIVTHVFRSVTPSEKDMPVTNSHRNCSPSTLKATRLAGSPREAALTAGNEPMRIKIYIPGRDWWVGKPADRQISLATGVPKDELRKSPSYTWSKADLRVYHLCTLSFFSLYNLVAIKPCSLEWLFQFSVFNDWPELLGKKNL